MTRRWSPPTRAFLWHSAGGGCHGDTPLPVSRFGDGEMAACWSAPGSSHAGSGDGNDEMADHHSAPVRAQVVKPVGYGAPSSTFRVPPTVTQ